MKSTAPTTNTSVVLKATRIVTSAEIRALAGTPVRLVAAPGLGRALLPLAATFSPRPGSVPYTTYGSTLTVSWDPGLASLIAVSDAILLQPAGNIDAAPLAGNGLGPQSAGNMPLVLYNAYTDLTDGNGELSVTVWYVVADL